MKTYNQSNAIKKPFPFLISLFYNNQLRSWSILSSQLSLRLSNLDSRILVLSYPESQDLVDPRWVWFLPSSWFSYLSEYSSISRFTVVTSYQRLSVMTGGDFSDTLRFPYRHLISCSLCTPLRCPFDSSNNSPSSTSLDSGGVMSAVVDIVVDPLCRTCHR